MASGTHEEVSVILYDGLCNLCSASVRFVMKYDREHLFRFTPIQSETGNKLLGRVLQNKQETGTIVYLEGEKVYLRSTAILRILKKLGRGWQLLYVLHIIPAFIRDPAYDLVAWSRYRIFGRRKSCAMIPPDREYRI